MTSTKLWCPAVLVKQGFGWGVQSRGLIKPGLGHSYSRIFSKEDQVQSRSYEEYGIYLHGNKKNHFMSIDSQLASLWNRGLGQLGNGIVTTTDTIRGMGTSFQRNDFWVRLGGQALVVIGRWCSGQPGTNHRLSLSTHKIPEIVSPKACTHSPYSFGSGKWPRFCMRLGWCRIEFHYGIVLGDENKGFGCHKGRQQLHRCRTSKKHSNEV